MTLNEFHAKPLTSNSDAVLVIENSTFDDLCMYIADGPDAKVMRLLNGLWMSRRAFADHQLLEAATRTLFPSKGYMRPAASVTAMKLIKAIGGEADLQALIQRRWPSITERDCNEVVLAFSGNDDIAGWMPLLPILFELNRHNDVRAQLVKAVNNIVRARELPEARVLLGDFLRRMPSVAEAYFNMQNFEFIQNLKRSFDS